MIIGTQEGIVLLYYISDKNPKLLAKSTPGLMFGEVTAVALQQDDSK